LIIRQFDNLTLKNKVCFCQLFYTNC